MLLFLLDQKVSVLENFLVQLQSSKMSITMLDTSGQFYKHQNLKESFQNNLVTNSTKLYIITQILCSILSAGILRGCSSSLYPPVLSFALSSPILTYAEQETVFRYENSWGLNRGSQIHTQMCPIGSHSHESKMYRVFVWLQKEVIRPQVIGLAIEEILNFLSSWKCYL